MVTHGVNPRRRNQGGELLDQLIGCEKDGRGPVAPAALELVEKSAVGELR
jgi:hypothetical protein